MDESGGGAGVNWRQAGGEAVLIFLGVALALSGQAWWEYHGDRGAEVDILRGVREDLGRDLADIGAAIEAAKARAAGADDLLVLIGDPDGGVAPEGRTWRQTPSAASLTNADALESARARYPLGAVSAVEALQMVTSADVIQRFDLSDGTFSEASSAGQLNVVRDTDLRKMIADYYYNSGRLGNTSDTRVDFQWQAFVRVLAESGLSMTSAGTDERVIIALRADHRLVAEVRNVKSMAFRQIQALDAVLRAAETLAARLDASAALDRGQEGTR